MNVELPLKAFRLNPRKPSVSVDADGRAVVLYLPAYFGRRRWTVALDELGVIDLTQTQHQSPADDAAFATPLLLPYLFTTGPASAPTTGLLFKSPQRVPPIRATAAWAPNTNVPVGFLESRSRHGADLDGVLVRFTNPSPAHAALVEAGAEQVTDLVSWYRRHRRIISSPIERDTTRRRLRRITWLARSSYLLIAAAVVGAAAAGDDIAWYELTAMFAALIGSFVVRALAFRMSKTSRRAA